MKKTKHSINRDRFRKRIAQDIVRMIEDRTEIDPVDLMSEGYGKNHGAEVIRRIISSAVMEYCEIHGIRTLDEWSAQTITRNSFKVRAVKQDDKTLWRIECDWHRFDWELGT